MCPQEISVFGKMWAKLELSDTSVFKSRAFLLKEISVRSFKATSMILLDVSLM